MWKWMVGHCRKSIIWGPWKEAFNETLPYRFPVSATEEFLFYLFFRCFLGKDN